LKGLETISAAKSSSRLRVQPAQATACKSREILKDRLRADLRVYKDAVERLDAAVFEKSDRAFDGAVKNAETAQRAFRLARESYNKHVASHNSE
jgi:hypothetical protein